MQGFFASIQSVMNVFSMLFTLTSAYIAGLFFFLNRAPFLLRLLAFGLLSLGFVFLGGSAATLQRMQDGLYAAWSKLPAPILTVSELRNPVDLPVTLIPGLSLQEVGVLIGWFTAAAVYLALAYLTFLHRWKLDDMSAAKEAD